MALKRVVIQDGDNSADLSVGEFLALPLDRRVRLVLEQRLQFFDDTGGRLSAADGLKLLRAARETDPVPAR
jgi:hypothetical protein